MRCDGAGFVSVRQKQLCIAFLNIVKLVSFVTAALNQGKETFRKLKTSVSSAELRARMCKAGSSSNDAVRLMQKQQLVQQREHAPHPPQEPLSSAAAAAAAAAIDVSAALHGPIIIPRPALCSLPTDSLLQLKTAPPPPTSLASIDIILGRNSVAHPVKELRNIALTISAAVCDGAAFLDKQLKLQDCERLDTNRRKLAALTSVPGSVPRAAHAQLKSMRLLSERERLQASLRLLQNRRWYDAALPLLYFCNIMCMYHELQQLVLAEGQGNGQRELFLLGCVRRLIEEGAVLDGHSVRLLMSLYTQPSMSSEFTSPTVQCILRFLCGKFKVTPAQYDEWLRSMQLPLPPATIARDELALQRRHELYQRKTVAKWFRQKAEIMSMTKDLEYWLPHEIITQLKFNEGEEASSAPFLTQEEQQLAHAISSPTSSPSRAQSRAKSGASARSRPGTGRSDRGVGSDDESKWDEVAAAHLRTLKERASEQYWKQRQQQQQEGEELLREKDQAAFSQRMQLEQGHQITNAEV